MGIIKWFLNLFGEHEPQTLSIGYKPEVIPASINSADEKYHEEVVEKANLS